MIEVTRDPLAPEEITARVKKDTNGAVVTFLGTTRLFSRGKRVLYLEYEAYEGMAQKKMSEIVREIEQRWGIKDVEFCHRVGRIEIGDISLVVAVASPHRREAFAACLYAVDRLKQVVPIWKKEVFADGEVWVGTEEEAVQSSSPVAHTHVVPE